MKLWRICLMVAGFGLLLILTSCSEEISKNETEEFLAGLNTMMAQAANTQASQALGDFTSKTSSSSGAPISISSEIMEIPSPSIEPTSKFRAPEGIDSVYGTYEWNSDSLRWFRVDPNNPANAIKFQWSFMDNSAGSHSAYLLIDSLGFAYDTLPTKVWIGLNVDNGNIAWLKLGAHYSSPSEIDSGSVVFEIVDTMQIGAALSSDIPLDTTLSEVTLHIWTIDRTSQNYKVDLYVTAGEDGPSEIVMEDSDGWKMEIKVAEAVVAEDKGHEKHNVSGEITKDGNHAADISGFTWIPGGDTHQPTIEVEFPDGTVSDLSYYLDEESFQNVMQ